MSRPTNRTVPRVLPAALVAALAPVLLAAGPAVAGGPAGHAGPTASRACPPRAVALGWSDALDKTSVGGVVVGGLSDLALDARSHSFVSTVDDHGSDPARLWRIGDPAHPQLQGPPLVLRAPDGTPYTGTTADDEGLAVLPDGDYLVSSETEPSIRVYGRDGVQRAQLPVPARFAVASPGGAGQATANATLEGLTASPSGRWVVAAMEGTLSGDLPAGATAGDLRRFLVYERDASAPGGYALRRQIGYRVDPGQRVPEVAAVDDGTLLVEEASYAAATGNAVRLYAVASPATAPDVTSVPDLATAPASDVVAKTLVADLVACPSLGAPALEAQANPLLDNVEGLAVTWRGPVRRGSREVGLAMVSDDNFSVTQHTRVITLAASVPAAPTR